MAVNSSRDMIRLVADLNARRIPRLVRLLEQRAGGPPRFTRRQRDRLRLARQLHHRYFQTDPPDDAMIADRRHDPSEAEQLKRLAEWVVSTHRRLTGSSDERPINWPSRRLAARAPTERPAPAEYFATFRRVAKNDTTDIPDLEADTSTPADTPRRGT